MKVASLRSNLSKNPSGANIEDVPGDEETPCSSKAKTKLVVAPHIKRSLLNLKIKV